MLFYKWEFIFRHGLHGFLRKSLVFVILSEAKNLPNALGDASLRSA